MGFDQSFRFRDCPWCGLRDAQMAVLSMDTGTSGAGASPGSARTRWWTILACPRCAGVILIETNPKDEAPAHILQVLPRPQEDLAVAHLPDDVEQYYRDAIRVLDAGVPDAAAVQLRRTLEAAAGHHGFRTGSLLNRIRGLIKAGLVTTQFAQALDHVRLISNIGAHASDERLDEDTARRALRFTTQVLRNLFEIPAELAQIQREGGSDVAEADEQAAGNE